MFKFSLVEFSIRRPKLVIWATVALTLLFLTQFQHIKTDTNPKHMLPENSDVRVWNDEVDKTFALYEDTIVVGVENNAGVVAKDVQPTAIYVPLEKGANGAEIAEKIRTIVGKESGPERYYVAGDPVARDTFGAEMFKLMGIFSPIAGMIMFIAIQLMFRNLSLSFTMMGVAMAAIILSMGSLLGAGYPVHIMSSMAPVFLMAIGTDSIPIFNEFYFRYREKRNKNSLKM